MNIKIKIVQQMVLHSVETNLKYVGSIRQTREKCDKNNIINCIILWLECHIILSKLQSNRNIIHINSCQWKTIPTLFCYLIYISYMFILNKNRKKTDHLLYKFIFVAGRHDQKTHQTKQNCIQLVSTYPFLFVCLVRIIGSNLPLD